MPSKAHALTAKEQAGVLWLAVHLDNGHDFVIVNQIHKRCRYSYSVGLTRRKVPEILVAGLKEQAAMELLSDIGNFLLGREAARELPTYETKPIRHAVAQDLAPVTDILCRGEFQLHQVVLQDKHGRFPWESGYDESLSKKRPSFWLHEETPDM